MSNLIEIQGDIAYVHLNGGLITVVDANYVGQMRGIHWYARKSGGDRLYACFKKNGKRTLLHRLINNTPDGSFTDHVNGDSLDNRRSNLRTATLKQNLHNAKQKKDSPFGKCVRKHGKGYAVRIKGDHGSLSLSGFMTARSAEKAYELISQLLRGDFAWIKSRDVRFPEAK